MNAKHERKDADPDRKVPFHEQLAADINDPPASEKDAVQRIKDGPMPGIGKNPDLKADEVGEPQGYAGGKTEIRAQPGPVNIEGNDLEAAQEAQRRQREKAEDPPRGHGNVNTTASMSGRPPTAPVEQHVDKRGHRR